MRNGKPEARALEILGADRGIAAMVESKRASKLQRERERKREIISFGISSDIA